MASLYIFFFFKLTILQPVRCLQTVHITTVDYTNLFKNLLQKVNTDQEIKLFKAFLYHKYDALNNLRFTPLLCFTLFSLFDVSSPEHGVDWSFRGFNRADCMGYFLKRNIACYSHLYIHIYILLYTICKDFYRAQSRIWYELVFF